MTTSKLTTKLGKTGPAVSRIGLGAMGMSGVYGATDDAESIATIHAALDSGANLIDTGDFYGAAEILPAVRELGIGITAYGVLSRGLLSDSVRPGATFAPTDFRAHSPRFQGENLDQNLKLVDALTKIAAEKDVSVAQLAIAWVLTRGADIVPILGARTRQRWSESLGAVDIQLSAEELATIEATVPVDQIAGDRYAAAQMELLDSER
ncbi:aldo/keto reductase [Nocardia sp. NPDC051990]|uniref:aldo/keto reductase n=1 Tax=Nocardia sp. NPDC051990 TaxID=3155285 RepID=UPI003438664B